MSYDDQPQDHDAPPERDVVPDAVAAKVRIPAIFLIVVGVLNILGAGYWAFNGSIMLANPAQANEQANQLSKAFNPNQEKDMKAAGIDPIQFTKSMGMGYVGLGIVGVLAALLTILAGVRMLSMKSRGLAIFGSVLALIPCISFMGCCGIGEGVGIWSLVVLMSADVKAA